jgi:fructose-1,6-bisphosphatase I
VSFEGNEDASYVIVIDPLDGSSNIDVNVSIGTIFGVYERVSPHGTPVELKDFLQSGRAQVAAGYVLYSVSTQMVISTGHGLHIFTLEPWKRAYHRVVDHVKMPRDGKVYSINEVNYDDFEPRLKRFVQYCKDKRKINGNRQYNLLKGGIYIYPGVSEAPNGKIRLVYECNPIAYLAAQAGGYATDGKETILDRKPKELHEKSPFYVGSPEMMDEAMKP